MAQSVIERWPKRIAFSAMMSLAILAYNFWLHDNLSGQLAILIYLLAITGLPHGAIDPAIARRAGFWQGAGGLMVFSLSYFLLSLAMVGIWFVSPEVLVIPLLVLSAWHFSGDWLVFFDRPLSLAVSVSVITLPAFFFEVEVTSIFDLLVPNSSAVVVELMGLIAVVSTLYVVCRCMSAPDLSKIALIEIFTLFCASVALPPIPYFTLYFCLLHSPLHLHESLSKLGFSQVIVFALPFTVLGIAAGIAFLIHLPAADLSQQIIQVIFIGLFALTVPHMVLIALSRKRGS